MVSSFFRYPKHYFFILFILIGNETSAITVYPGKAYIPFKEITKVDITEYKDIKSTEITVFGLYLNMKLEDIVKEVDKYDFIYVEKDVFNENRLYLYDDKATNADNTLAYLILDENTFDLKQIVLYPNMIKYLIGNTKKLLTLEMINQNSDIVKYFTGVASCSLLRPVNGSSQFSWLSRRPLPFTPHKSLTRPPRFRPGRCI